MDLTPQAVELPIQGAFLIDPVVHRDDRGSFRELYSSRSGPGVGKPLSLNQANCSVSARSALRGISYDLRPTQTKVVTCVKGAVLDVVVDLRQGSPTFGQWHLAELAECTRRSLLVTPGLGHGYLALTDGATVLYLLAETFDPEYERRLHPLDPSLGIAWPDDVRPVLSPKDSAAPGLREARQKGLLPTFGAPPFAG
ncbi:dTDP-4-dehydrorhamnose 3,5-epimerase family protein [Kitasatospora purpeofusca]|uniref:dTDP-4-dehydrorhamnose 3,5-epimerase family protein n=1 Tax=Kitasatospora purpeofusca TaxID=67352 RepID=UPI0036EE65DB